MRIYKTRDSAKARSINFYFPLVIIKSANNNSIGNGDISQMKATRKSVEDMHVFNNDVRWFFPQSSFHSASKTLMGVIGSFKTHAISLYFYGSKKICKVPYNTYSSAKTNSRQCRNEIHKSVKIRVQPH